MKNFEYAAPRTETEVLEYLSSDNGKTEVLAGGTDLVDLLKGMVLTPDRVVNIMEIESLKRIEQFPDGSVTIGAAVTLDDLIDRPELSAFAAIGDAIKGISSAQLQSQGTIGGEVLQRPQCWYFRSGNGLLADNGRLVAEGDNRLHAIFDNAGPAKFVSGTRLAQGLIALNARLRVIGPAAGDEKIIALADLYRTPLHDGQRENTLLPNQIVTHVMLPANDGRVSATYEVRQGCGPEYPLASAAACLAISGGVVEDAMVVLGHVAPTPWASEPARRVLFGSRVTPETAAAAGEAAVSRATPLSHNEYKIQLAQVAVKRAILKAAGFETGGL